jgi:hypothetical protein
MHLYSQIHCSYPIQHEFHHLQLLNNTEPGGEPELVKGKRSCVLVDTRHDEQHRTWGRTRAC